MLSDIPLCQEDLKISSLAADNFICWGWQHYLLAKAKTRAQRRGSLPRTHALKISDRGRVTRFSCRFSLALPKLCFSIFYFFLLCENLLPCWVFQRDSAHHTEPIWINFTEEPKKSRLDGHNKIKLAASVGIIFLNWFLLLLLCPASGERTNFAEDRSEGRQSNKALL